MKFSHLSCLCLFSIFVGIINASGQHNEFLELPGAKLQPDNVIKDRDIELSALHITPAGNYLFAGTLFPDKKIRYGDYWMALTDVNGKVIWEKTIHALGDDRLIDACATVNGKYALAGTSSSGKGGDKISESNGRKDYWIVQLSSTGEIEWQQNIGGPHNDELLTLLTTHNGYSLGGWSFSDQPDSSRTELDQLNFAYSGFEVIDLDLQGKIISRKFIQEDGFGELHYYYYLNDGGYLLRGVLASPWIKDPRKVSWIIRLDAEGNIRWIKLYTDPEINVSYFDKLIETDQGDFYLGRTVEKEHVELENEYYTNTEYQLLHLSPDGEVINMTNYGGDRKDELIDIFCTKDREILIGGNSDSDKSGKKTQNTPGDNFSDIWIVALDSTGEIKWQKSFGGYDNEKLCKMQECDDGSYVIAGYSRSDSSYTKATNSFGDYDYWIVKYNPVNGIEWQKTLGGNDFDMLEHAQITPDQGVLLAGTSFSGRSGNKTVPNLGEMQTWMVKLNKSGNMEWQRFWGDTNSIAIMDCMVQDEQGLIYAVIEDLKYQDYRWTVYQLSPDGSPLDTMLLVDNFFFYNLPIHFGKQQQAVIGNNQFVLLNFLNHSYEIKNQGTNQTISRLLITCFKNLKNKLPK